MKSAVGLVVLIAVVSSVLAVRGKTDSPGPNPLPAGAVARAEQSYASCAGTFTLEVHEARGRTMKPSSSSVLVLKEGKSRRYRVRLGFAVQLADVAPDGRVVVAGLGARDAYGFEGTSAVLAFLDADGEVTALHTQSRASDPSRARTAGQYCRGVFAIADGFLVRSAIARGDERREQWVVYDPGGTQRGTLDASLLVQSAGVEPAPRAVSVIGSTNFVLSVWWSEARDSDEYVVVVHDLGNLLAPGARAAERAPVWMERREAGISWPLLRNHVTPQGAELHLAFSRRNVPHEELSFRVSKDGRLVVERIGEEAAESGE